MKRINRKRNHTVTFRMDPAEYSEFRQKVKEAGISQQAYIINAIHGASVMSSDEINVLKDISLTFADHERQLRGLATNVNQMAHAANAQGFIPSAEELKEIASRLASHRKESERIWQSIRSSINQQKVTGL